MRNVKLIALAASASVLVIVSLLVACGGSSDSGDTAQAPAANVPLLLTDPLTKTEATVDAARLLTQASFGISHAAMVDITKNPSLEAWIDEQMAKPVTLQLPLVEAFGNGSLRPPRHYVWWDTAVNADDQLRQRVAFAMSEIFVVSDIDYLLGNAQHGIVNYYDMLSTNAFGNFRDLIEDITLHPVMGIYLSMIRNEKADAERNIRPDENYAREIMQLFTIGLYQLDEGGTPIPVGNPTPAYTQNDVEEYARVFTGWNFADSPEWQSTNLTQYDKITPLVPQEDFHDKGTKQLLGGVVVPAGQTAREDLEIALDSLFNHPNVGPFLAKLFIQRMVSSNPSKDYVARVAAVFNDNGAGVRGDLGAMIKAMLLDDEARQGGFGIDASETTALTQGKFKEPLLRITHMYRALNAVPGRSSEGYYHMYSKTADVVGDVLGQAVQSSPSVFNFFQPSFRSSQVLPSDSQSPLLAPEMQILSESLVSAANNDLHSIIYNGHNRREQPHRGTMVNIDGPMFMLKKGRDVYLEHMNILLMAGTMTAGMQDILAAYIDEIVTANRVGVSTINSDDANDAVDQQSLNIDAQLAVLSDDVLQTIVVDSVYMMLASPEFLVQR